MCKIYFDACYLFHSDRVLKFEGTFEECCNIIHKMYDENVICSDEEVFYIEDENEVCWYPKYDKYDNPNGVEIGTRY
jgi:hypothetical protein